MKRFHAVWLAGALCLFLSACGGGQTSQPAPTPAPSTGEGATTPTVDAAKAETTFKNSCASCHGQNLEGAVGPNLTAVGSKLSKDDILGILKNGKGIMPKDLVTGEDADNLAAWLAEKK